eukprot:GHRR01026577.1.p1 GENE.GHRR01026577.1~~GHRR01026577.1.p1  ORF type:complete len:134 (-),score=32.71 GHRR01026577.1:577-978(-)
MLKFKGLPLSNPSMTETAVSTVVISDSGGYLQQPHPVLDVTLFLLHPEKYCAKDGCAADVAAEASHGCSLVACDLTPAAAQQQAELPAYTQTARQCSAAEQHCNLNQAGTTKSDGGDCVDAYAGCCNGLVSCD